jgi:predicted alpha/beta superfamily hydrolase
MKLEEEAYLKGNIVFRSWTESLEENFDDKPTEHMRKLIKIDETTIKNIIKNKRELKK